MLATDANFISPDSMVTHETCSRDYIDPIIQTRIYLDANSSPIVLWACTPSNYSKLMFDPSSFICA